MDTATKFTIGFSIQDLKGTTIAKCLEEIFTHHDPPYSVRCDSHKSNTSQIIGIKTVFTSSDTPHINHFLYDGSLSTYERPPIWRSSLPDEIMKEDVETTAALRKQETPFPNNNIIRMRSISVAKETLPRTGKKLHFQIQGRVVSVKPNMTYKARVKKHCKKK
uniref:DDE_Tnp_1_7 domain-containing protein n=1 Tax=Strongyloides papillosus TaxID=174720 RepID=A0A0N5B4Z2_STREA